MIQEFWMCLVEGGSCPTFRHESEAQAKAEAERLARQEKKPVYVLQAIDSVKVADVIWEKPYNMPF